MHNPSASHLHLRHVSSKFLMKTIKCILPPSIGRHCLVATLVGSRGTYFRPILAPNAWQLRHILFVRYVSHVMKRNVQQCDWSTLMSISTFNYPHSDRRLKPFHFICRKHEVFKNLSTTSRLFRSLPKYEMLTTTRQVFTSLCSAICGFDSSFGFVEIRNKRLLNNSPLGVSLGNEAAKA